MKALIIQLSTYLSTSMVFSSRFVLRISIAVPNVMRKTGKIKKKGRMSRIVYIISLM